MGIQGIGGTAGTVSSVSKTRAKLLRYIIECRFSETFGKDWWEMVLLPHMRDEAIHRTDQSGDKYATILKRCGRGISFSDLDTTVCCTIILYDPYFKFGTKGVKFSNYEIGLVRQIHALRNKMSHEEGEYSQTKETEEKLVKLMYRACIEMDLTGENPVLAREILSAYSSVFTGEKMPEDAEAFLRQSERFEKAEDLFAWDLGQAMPIYTELAENGFEPARKRLLMIYTQTTTGFDLKKAIALGERYRGLCTEEQMTKLRILLSLMPHAVWGTPQVVKLFLDELKSGSLINNAQMEAYLLWIRGKFPTGLLPFVPSGAEYGNFRTEAAKKQPDVRKLAKLTAEMENGLGRKYCELLVREAGEAYFGIERMDSSLQMLAQEGYLLLADTYEAGDNGSDEKAAESAEVSCGTPEDGMRILELEETLRQTQSKLGTAQEQAALYKRIAVAEALAIAAMLVGIVLSRLF